MRALFFGTPEIAVPSLLALRDVCDVVAVVCQPDRPAGRGMKLRAPAVKEAALELGLEVVQPTQIRTPAFEDWVRAQGVDLALVIAYGRILPQRVLELPRLGFLNLHASLLPSYRGAAPIQRALMNGDSETGVCLMQMDVGMDTGPVLAVQTLPIETSDDAGSLFAKLATVAAEVTRRELPRLFAGQLEARAQDHSRASHAPPIHAADAVMTFDKDSAAQLSNRVRGLSPRPGGLTSVRRPAHDGSGDPKAAPSLRIVRAQATPAFLTLAPGEVGIDAGRLFVGTREGLLEILEAQLEGKRVLPARDLVNGRALLAGDRLG